MKAEVRDILGKVAYEATYDTLEVVPWEQRGEDIREMYRRQAEAVVKELASMLVPTLITVLLTEEDMKEVLDPIKHPPYKVMTTLL